jgi:hypothetical protein
MNLDLLCALPFIVIIVLGLPLLLDPDPKYFTPSRRPPKYPPGYRNRK